ncbi:MAG: hypothetical protein H0V62_12965 [Gammaproteobacteria bacterium]|nr:hypothetical protein [Gammaproteobacteria bacterium]
MQGARHARAADGSVATRLARSWGGGSCLLFVAVLGLACTHARPADPRPPAMRIIVKFIDAARSAPDKLKLIQPLGAPVKLRHARLMSGGVHLYSGRMNKRQRAVILRKLNRRPEVDYAEADRRLSY